MENIDDMAVQAALSDDVFSSLVENQKRFIISCAYRATHKFITVSDDEWSVALIAFAHAVKTYNKEKGSFQTFAEIIIKRHLIDYYRSTKKYRSELTVNPSVFEGEIEDQDSDLVTQIEVSEKLVCTQNNAMKDEIEAANAVFQQFGFSFFTLTQCSPKSTKTKAACRQAVTYILKDPSMIKEIYETKQLPIKKLQKVTKLPRKLLEHHRRYIIAAIEILSGEYPLLAEYMSFIRKEGVEYESNSGRN